MFKKTLIASAAVMGMLSLNAQAVVIDTFNTTTQTGAGTLATAPGESLGGFRTQAAIAGNVSSFGSNGTFTPGVYAHSQNVGTSGTSQLTWDANGAGLGGVDLTNGGAEDALQLNVTFIDQGLVTLTFKVTDTLNNTSTLALSGLGIGNSAFLFTSFAGAANFASVNSVSLDVAAGLAGDLTLDLVQTRQGVINAVPVPPSVWLMGAGLVGLLTFRRKAQHA